MSKQQTAVEWLEDRLDNLLELYASEWDKVSNVINQAKAMEKEQIETAYSHGQNNGYMYRDGTGDIIKPDQYFNQTFKTESE